MYLTFHNNKVVSKYEYHIRLLYSKTIKRKSVMQNSKSVFRKSLTCHLLSERAGLTMTSVPYTPFHPCHLYIP